jgi:hypothetical protein
VKAAQSAQLVGLQQTDGEHFEVVPVPAPCRSNDVTVLHYAGVGLFAEVARIDEEWPKVEDSTNSSRLSRNRDSNCQQSESAPAWTATMTAAWRAGESCAHGVL